MASIHTSCMKACAAFRHWAEDTTRGGQSPNPEQHLPERVRGIQPGTYTAGGAADLQGRQRGQEAVPTWGQPVPREDNQPVPLRVSEPAEASARRHVRKPETHEHGHLPSQKCQPLSAPAASPFLGFPYWPTAAGKRSPSQLLINFSSYFRVRFLSTSIQLTTCPSGLPHTHRFSGSELKGSALISNRLMTEPPGRVPDIPARTSVGENSRRLHWLGALDSSG